MEQKTYIIGTFISGGEFTDHPALNELNRDLKNGYKVNSVTPLNSQSSHSASCVIVIEKVIQ